MTMIRRYAGATPVGPDAHVNVPLTNIAIEAFAAPSDAAGDVFVGDQLFPSVTVGKQSDKYYVIEKGEFLRAPASTLRAQGTEARRVEFRVSSDSYFAHNYALAAENPLESLANADVAIRLRENSTRLVVGLLRLDQEIRIANAVTSISNIGSGVQLTGTDKWSDPNSDPRADVRTGHAFIRQNTGLRANTAVIDADTFEIIRTHPLLLDMYKYTSGGQLGTQQLADVLGVQRILVPTGIKHNEVEGAATASVTNVWGNVCLLAHVAAGTGLQTKTLGLRMQWRNGIFPANFGVLTNVENKAGQKKVEVLEAGYYQDEKLVAGSLGYLIDDTL